MGRLTWGCNPSRGGGGWGGVRQENGRYEASWGYIVYLRLAWRIKHYLRKERSGGGGGGDPKPKDTIMRTRPSSTYVTEVAPHLGSQAPPGW